MLTNYERIQDIPVDGPVEFLIDNAFDYNKCERAVKLCDDTLTKDEQCDNDCTKHCKEMNIWRVSLWNKIRCSGKKLMYAYGSFENAERVILIGFVYKTKKELVRKIKKAKYDGWHYDGVYCPLIQCDVLPSYVNRRY